MFGGYGRRSYGGESLLEELVEIDEIQDLMDGDFEGAMEDEILLDFI